MLLLMVVIVGADADGGGGGGGSGGDGGEPARHTTYLITKCLAWKALSHTG